MSPNYKRIEAVFDALLDYSVDERTARGKKLCGDDKALWHEVESLLKAADRANGFLSNPPDQHNLSTLLKIDPSTFQGQRFGAYKIISEVDRGGMGVVFLAERADGHYQNQVAIKVSSYSVSSDDSMQAFHAERQFLANLKHSNIAQLIDGGTSECGHPYLVMELIQGVAIDHYCNTNGLSVRDKLDLLIPVFDAVHYAHQNLIVHCDLKPANILVSADGMPKLLDFGIATLMKPGLLNPTFLPGKQARAEPINQAIPFTPEFAAPEQLQGKPATTAADIYSLGVLLYKMLSDRLPYCLNDESLKDVAYAVASAEVPAPSEVAPRSLKKVLKGDLDQIVMKALHKDPAQRYSSVQMFSEDLNRYLSGMPVQASADTYLYRTGKFIQRHKWGVSLLSLAVVSLLLGSIISTWQWQIARDQQEQAEQRLEKVHELTSLIVFELPGSIANLPQSTVLVERLITKGVGYLDDLAASNADNPKLQSDLATAYRELARLQGNPMNVNLGDASLARNTIGKAISIQEQLLRDSADNESALHKSKFDLAISYTYLSGLEAASFGNLKLAHKLTDQSVTLLESLDDRNSNKEVLRRLLVAYSLASHWYNVEGDYPKARDPLRKAEQLYALLGEHHPFVQSAHGHRLYARLHEEWAEIESMTGNKQNALMHEKHRLEITVTHLSKTKNANRYIGAAYHALAARMASVKQLVEAEDAYLNARSYWEMWNENFSSDVSGIQALVVINAELAELYARIASSVPLPEASRRAKENVCTAYAQSLFLLGQLPEGKTTFPRRYTWSPSPGEIIAGESKHCRSLQNKI